MDAVAVEVRGLSSAFYKAYIKNISQDSLTVVFEDNLQLEVEVPFRCVRLPPPSDNYSSIGVGDEVEVYSRTNIQEPCGWWLARVVSIIREAYQIQYAACGSAYKELVPAENIRPRNPNMPFTQASKIPVPEDPSEMTLVRSLLKSHDRHLRLKQGLDAGDQKVAYLQQEVQLLKEEHRNVSIPFDDATVEGLSKPTPHGPSEPASSASPGAAAVQFPPSKAGKKKKKPKKKGNSRRK